MPDAARMKSNLMRKITFVVVLGAAALACRSVALTAAPVQHAPAPSTTAPDVPALEVTMLTEVLQEMDGCPSEQGVQVQNNAFSFSCSNSADTHYTVSMTRFDSEAQAAAQFDVVRAASPVECFHGYTLFATRSPHPSNRYIEQELLTWQAGQWLISIDTSYDYGYFHFTAMNFAESLYTSGLRHELFHSGDCPPEGLQGP